MGLSPQDCLHVRAKLMNHGIEALASPEGSVRSEQSYYGLRAHRTGTIDRKRASVNVNDMHRYRYLRMVWSGYCQHMNARLLGALVNVEPGRGCGGRTFETWRIYRENAYPPEFFQETHHYT